MYEYVKTWLELKTDKRAVTALEYGLIAGVLVITMIVGFNFLGGKMQTQFNLVATHLNAT
jgi:Flp pilus assembly pilin Flp